MGLEMDKDSPRSPHPLSPRPLPAVRCLFRPQTDQSLVFYPPIKLFNHSLFNHPSNNHKVTTEEPHLPYRWYRDLSLHIRPVQKIRHESLSLVGLWRSQVQPGYPLSHVRQQQSPGRLHGDGNTPLPCPFPFWFS